MRVAKVIWYTTRFRQIVKRIISSDDTTAAGFVSKSRRRVVCMIDEGCPIAILEENSKSPQTEIGPNLKFENLVKI